MKRYSAIAFLKAESELITKEIEQLTALCAGADLDIKRQHPQLLRLLESSRNECDKEYFRLCEELEAIKEEDPEIFTMIYLHDMKHRTWREVFNKTCKGIMCLYPESYCKNIVVRYLKRKKLL